MAVAKAVKTKLVPVGTLIDTMWGLREKKREQEALVKLTSAEIELIEEQIMAGLDASGQVAGTGKLASASVTEAVKPNVKNWDLFYAFIHKHKYYHLLERRPSVTGCRELFETKGMVPGVEPSVKRTLNLRTVNG